MARLRLCGKTQPIAKRAKARQAGTIMMSFEPNYTILTFLMIKTFFYVEGIGALGLIRAITATGLSRMFAFLTVVISVAAIAAKYVPPLAGLSGSEPAQIADGFLKAGIFMQGDGMVLPVLVTALFALSAFVRGRRWWMLDGVFALAALGFFGLFGYTLL